MSCEHEAANGDDKEPSSSLCRSPRHRRRENRCRNEPSSIVTSRAAYRHCKQSCRRRVESTKQTAATTKRHASSVSRRHRYRRQEARLAAPSCRVSARNMRRVGHASKCRRRVVNIELPTATMTSHRVASADAPLIDGESTACRNEPSSLVTSRAAYWRCQQSRRRRVEST